MFLIALLSLLLIPQSVSAQGRRLEGDLEVTPVRGSVHMMVMFVRIVYQSETGDWQVPQ